MQLFITANIERPTNIVIGRPVVNTNVVVLSNNITNQYNNELTSSTATISPPLKPVSVMPNRGAMLNNANPSLAPIKRNVVRNSITPDEAQNLEQNLKAKIATLNMAIQKQHLTTNKPASDNSNINISINNNPPKFEVAKVVPNLNLPRPPTYNETTVNDPSPPKPIPHRKPPGEQMLPMRISPPPTSTSPPNNTIKPPTMSTSPTKPLPSTSPPNMPPTSAPKHTPAPRRFGVKLDSFSNMDQLEKQANAQPSQSPPTSTSPPSQIPILTSAAVKKKPDIPVKPLPACPPGALAKTSTPSSSAAKTTTVVNPNAMNLWKCLPDEPVVSSPKPTTTTHKVTYHIPPTRPPPPPPARNVVSPTRERADTAPAPALPPRDLTPKRAARNAENAGAQGNAKNAGDAARPLRPPRTTHLTYPRRQGSGNKISDP